MKLNALFAAALSLCCLTACSQSKQKSESETKQKTTQMKSQNQKILIAYFSRADENYSVGYVKKGNTAIIAEMIQAQVGGDLFHIETVNAYPADYDTCIEVAKKELEQKARPEIKGDAKVEDYDIIYIGYPNWWGEAPMALYTFIEKHNWQGKTIVPFVTHEGSGFGGTDKRVAAACKGATALKGLAIAGHVAQNSQDSAKKQVEAWLSK